jgi:transaldolase
VATDYFHRVHKLSPTRFWINNPTREQADLAIAAGAVGCTLNPSYGQKLIDHPDEGPYALKLLEAAVRETTNDVEAVAEFQRKVALPVLEKFQPIYRRNPGGLEGLVSIQGDPIREDDPKVIIDEGRANRAIAENVCCKIPTTHPGLVAIETLLPEGTPINATEVFGMAQVVALGELYVRLKREHGNHLPVMFYSHIAGIYDDHFRNVVAEDDVDIAPDLLVQAGLAVSRRAYQTVKERGYGIHFIGGGARALYHFTELVGGDLVVTINWQGTAEDLIALDPPVVYRIHNPVPPQVIDELSAKLVDFRRGWSEDGLKVDEFEEFGPVQLFRSIFVKSWQRVTMLAGEIRARM